jgi:hypothetical protein
MKFYYGAIPENENFVPDPHWQQMNEPDAGVLIWMALPLALLSGGGLMLLWFGFTSLKWIEFIYWYVETCSWYCHVLLFVGLVVVHEVLHGLVQPGFGLKTTFGLWLKKGAFYAYYDGIWSRNRALFCFFFPLLVLTIVPLVIGMLPESIVPWRNEDVMAAMLYISVLNGFFSSADLIGLWLMFYRVPQKAVIRNKGYFTYWRENA